MPCELSPSPDFPKAPPRIRRRVPWRSSLRVVRPRSFPASPWLTISLFPARAASGSRVEDPKRPLDDFGRSNYPATLHCAPGGPHSYFLGAWRSLVPYFWGAAGLNSWSCHSKYYFSHFRTSHNIHPYIRGGDWELLKVGDLVKEGVSLAAVVRQVIHKVLLLFWSCWRCRW